MCELRKKVYWSSWLLSQPVFSLHSLESELSNYWTSIWRHIACDGHGQIHALDIGRYWFHLPVQDGESLEHNTGKTESLWEAMGETFFLIHYLFDPKSLFPLSSRSTFPMASWPYSPSFRSQINNLLKVQCARLMKDRDAKSELRSTSPLFSRGWRYWTQKFGSGEIRTWSVRVFWWRASATTRNWYQIY